MIIAALLLAAVALCVVVVVVHDCGEVGVAFGSIVAVVLIVFSLANAYEAGRKVVEQQPKTAVCVEQKTSERGE